jgi:hypothetical protein
MEKKLIVLIPLQLHQDFKGKVSKNGTNMRAKIIELITEYLKEEVENGKDTV